MRSTIVPTMAMTIALGLAGAPAFAQNDTTPPPRQGAVSMDKFKALRAQCEAAACSKTGGDVCAEAARLMMGDQAPGEIYDMNSNQKVRFSLRLLEHGVGSSNLARAMAYDIYNSSTMFSSGYADPYRAKEIMDIMLAAGYPGATLRKARENVGIFAATSPDDEKGRSCTLAKNLLAKGQLDADSKRIAQDIVETSSCVSLEPVKN